ncbi:hypothetical protein ABT340_15505 [Streptosporangium sp. NPDC000239]|uniref:hypothetical protein n=1 Tax=Streptosporangium sp. NPDC000239 TaxID=3154248 RepID=UPI00333144BA
MVLGPLDLIAGFDAPKVLYSNDGLMILGSSSQAGTLYEILPTDKATVGDLRDGLNHIPQHARLKDAFSDQGEICISVWL